MKVIKTKKIGSGHSIEIGESTWDASKMSIRNRYPTSTGGFSPRSSSELPLGDLQEIMTVIADEDLLEPKVLAKIIKSLSESIARQT